MEQAIKVLILAIRQIVTEGIDYSGKRPKLSMDRRESRILIEKYKAAINILEIADGKPTSLHKDIDKKFVEGHRKYLLDIIAGKPVSHYEN